MKKNGQELNRTLYDAQGQKAVHLHYVSGMEETAYLGPNLTIRDGKYLTKHVYVGDQRVSSKMDPDWFQYPPTLYFHTDHLGSTQYVSNDEQTLVPHDEYLPSGEPWHDETDSKYELARRFNFTGKELDIHTGLYDYGARSYDARMGVWLSPDPVLANYMQGKLNQGVFRPSNLMGYTYSFNNPVTLVDPDGQYARISRKGDSVSIVLPMLFRNKSGLSQEQFAAKVSSWRSAIEKTWSGKFGNLKVDTRVEMLNEAEAREIGVQGGGLNVIDVRDAPQKYDEAPGEVTGWAAPYGYKGNVKGEGARSIKGSHEESTGYLHSNADGGTAAHEAGHLLGLEHHEAPSEVVQENGRSRRVVDPSNIMATKADSRRDGARPNAQQLEKTIKQYCNSGCQK